ncbi:MAG: GAF domain-containing protein [Deltaproteobacteria bacterium]|nr:GAF domain-containing protein [Deltaproteobacteria bacterium]
MEEYPFRAILSLKPLIEYVKKSLLDPVAANAAQAEGLQELLDSAPELQGPIPDVGVLKRHGVLVEKLMSFVFPPIFWETEAVMVVVPFTARSMFVSPTFKRLFFGKEGNLLGKLNLDEGAFHRGRVIRAYLLVLSKLYDIHQDFEYPLIRTVSDPETGLNRHFKIRTDFRFIDVRPMGELKSLSDEERKAIMEHLTEPEVLRKILPPRDFELQGFTVLHAVDVTESEVISALGRDLVDQQSIISLQGFRKVQDRLRELFRRPSLVAGLTAIKEDQVLLLNAGCRLAEGCIFESSRHLPVSQLERTIWHRAIQGKEVLRVSDVLKEDTSGDKGVALDLDARSVLIAPLHYKGQVIGALHLGSPHPGDLGPMEALVMEQLQPLFAMGIQRALDDLENRVQRVIKQECTAIHPTVEWSFRKAALQHLSDLRAGRASKMAPIVFRDVYPLYSTSDIRGSTEERNRAIQKDLADHLEMALRVVSAAMEIKPLLILNELAGRIQRQFARVQGALRTGDELLMVKFLREEVEGIFPHLREFGSAVAREIAAYESAVDGNVGMVYRARRDFEESVHILNDRLVAYLDQEESRAQSLCPHYFERHRTDGVDYLIYLGGSLLDKGEFNEIYLKNLRLWQLKVACGMAWHTERLKAVLKIPLDTAHLILVQNTPLSIRFRFDEKRFDVDGAYDVRHEIVKSRIDKAVVRGTGERLTQPGTVAVVYSHPDEAKEMRRHIEFLHSEGLLTGSTDNLDLGDLPGIQGLRALRVSVNLENPGLAERFGAALPSQR